jgi:Fe2+ or Zn2+ uptake regulation protein
MVKKLRQTKQKELLNEEVKIFNSFFTAEELLSKANKKDSNLGIATIYRFLSDLVNKRQIHSYICNRKTIYSIDENSHCHFICEKCGKIEHIQVNSLDFIANKINGSICHFQIDVTGLCNQCSKK